ncbi:MAG TPA: cytochrome c family protein [Bacteroidota bacterium]
MKMPGLLSMLLGVAVISSYATAQNKYVGTKMCKACHNSEKQGKQFEVWSKTKHAEAYKTLATAKADDIAKAKGLTKPAAESPECLECHAKPVDPKLADKSYDAKDGVQCETCHGPGSAYKNMTIMKDKAKAIAAGLTDFKDSASIEKWCKTCHNEKSPTFKGFKFDEMWGKIKHPIPKS